jgi:hypothetical protein
VPFYNSLQSGLSFNATHQRSKTSPLLSLSIHYFENSSAYPAHHHRQMVDEKSCCFLPSTLTKQGLQELSSFKLRSARAASLVVKNNENIDGNYLKAFTSERLYSTELLDDFRCTNL